MAIRRVLAGIACLAHAGCASHPDRIEARYVSPTMYQAWSCDQLVEERTRLTKEVQRVDGLQRENANADVAMMTVGLVLLWPMLFGLAATKDRKDDVARLKGEYEAVETSIKTRPCALPPPPETPAAPVQPVAVTAGDATFKGRGKTDSWCQTPSLSLTVRGATVEGELSEVAGGTASGAVTGSLDNTGVLTLEIKSVNADHFSGKAEGTVRNGMLTIAFRGPPPKACGYSFDLKKE